MNQIIKFNRTTDYRGRNGQGIQTGIEIMNLIDYIVINPTNSKGVTDSCSMRIPVEDVSKLIELLKEYEPKPLICHISLRSDIDNNNVQAKHLRGVGKITESPETWSIDGDMICNDSSYLYDSEQEYIHDCEKLGLKRQKSFKEIALERINNNFTPT